MKAPWHTCPRWLRKQRDRRDDARNLICERKSYTALMTLFRITTFSDRICEISLWRKRSNIVRDQSRYGTRSSHDHGNTEMN